MSKTKFIFVADDQSDSTLQKNILDADHSPEAAAYLLVRVAEFLECGQPVPTRLATRIANAFKKTGNLKSVKNRPAKLAQELGLTTGTKPIKESFIRVGEYIENEMADDPKLTQTKAIAIAAKKFRISLTTARNYLNSYKQALHPPEE
jgi:hypothetical protein